MKFTWFYLIKHAFQLIEPKVYGSQQQIYHFYKQKNN